MRKFENKITKCRVNKVHYSSWCSFMNPYKRNACFLEKWVIGGINCFIKFSQPLFSLLMLKCWGHWAQCLLSLSPSSFNGPGRPVFLPSLLPALHFKEATIFNTSCLVETTAHLNLAQLSPLGYHMLLTPPHQLGSLCVFTSHHYLNKNIVFRMQSSALQRKSVKLIYRTTHAIIA